MVQNMIDVRNSLTKHNVPWQDASNDLIDRTTFTIQGHEFTVCNGFTTYGGYADTYTPHRTNNQVPKTIEKLKQKNKGLLELHIDSAHPIGGLTATNVLNIIDYILGTDLSS